VLWGPGTRRAQTRAVRGFLDFGGSIVQNGDGEFGGLAPLDRLPDVLSLIEARPRPPGNPGNFQGAAGALALPQERGLSGAPLNERGSGRATDRPRARNGPKRPAYATAG